MWTISLCKFELSNAQLYVACAASAVLVVYSTTLPNITVSKNPKQSWVSLADFSDSLSYLSHVQQVGKQTGCTHAAVWLDLKGQFIAGFEDIGRHVALDKLLGFRAMQLLNTPEYQHGVVLVSSRASYEMVQKTANCGVEFLLAVSAATSMAVDLAKQCNLMFHKIGRASC
ncbi:putative protein required for formate dehydrogenase activity, partial [Snodgrassella alvi SCGC AB-598-J21]